MQFDSNTIFEAAAKLPENERFALVARLMDTLPDDDSFLSLDDPGLKEELDRRFADQSGAIPWSQLRAED